MIYGDLRILRFSRASENLENNSPTEHINRQNSHSLGSDLDNTKIELVIWMSISDSLGGGLDVKKEISYETYNRKINTSSVERSGCRKLISVCEESRSWTHRRMASA